MGAIQKAIQEVKYAIPLEILNEVFLKRDSRLNMGRLNLPVSLDTMIREKVIDARVMIDCNLLGGTQVELPLSGITPEQVDVNKSVYRIPMTLTQNRLIGRVLSLTLGQSPVMNGTMAGVQGYSQILEAAQGAMNAQAGIPVISTASIRLIADNTVLVSDYMSIPRAAFLRCYLEHDDEYSQLNRMTYPHFSHLVELAVKAYVYNSSIIPMGMGQLSGGQDLGRYREVVDGFSDANQMYKDFIVTVWQKVQHMDDKKTFGRTLRALVGGMN